MCFVNSSVQTILGCPIYQIMPVCFVAEVIAGLLDIIIVFTSRGSQEVLQPNFLVSLVKLKIRIVL